MSIARDDVAHLARLARLALGQRPALHVCRPPCPPSLLCCRFVGTLALAAALPPCLTAVPGAVRRAGLGALAQGRGRASRGPHTLFPCLLGGGDPARGGDPVP